MWEFEASIQEWHREMEKQQHQMNIRDSLVMELLQVQDGVFKMGHSCLKNEEYLNSHRRKMFVQEIGARKMNF